VKTTRERLGVALVMDLWLVVSLLVASYLFDMSCYTFLTRFLYHSLQPTIPGRLGMIHAMGTRLVQTMLMVSS